MSARRGELLALAETILERDGIEAFGLGSLARAAGIRTPSLYKHFEGLADLEHALISRGFRMLGDALDQAGTGSGSGSGSGAGPGTGAGANSSTGASTSVSSGTSASSASPREHADPEGKRLSAFAASYRAFAGEHPQLYRLMTERPLDRALLEPGAEQAAMSALLAHFDERPGSHDRARAAWASAHGLVSLELAGRFPPGADLDEMWRVYVSAFASRRAHEPTESR